MSQLLPIFLKLEGRPVLLVGGGKIAKEKLAKLIPTKAYISIVAPRVDSEVFTFQQRHSSQIEIKQRKFLPFDLEGKCAVFSATDDPLVNRLIRRETSERGLFLNAADRATLCDFYLGGDIHRGPLCFSISSNGKNPGLVREFRKFLDEVLPEQHSSALSRFSEYREELKHRLKDKQERLRLLEKLNHWFRTTYLSSPEATRAR